MASVVAPTLLTTAEVADRFRLSPQTVRAWRRQGKLTGTRIGQRLRFDPSEVERIIREGQAR